MKQSCTTRVPLVAAALLAVATLLVAALLIAQCADIYRIGTAADNLTEAGVRARDIYSRELVAQRLKGISWSFFVWAAALAFALIAGACASAAQGGRLSPPLDNRLEQALARASLTPAMRAEERKRRNASILCAVACALCAVPVAMYFLDTAHFASRDLESGMGAMLLSIAPWVLIVFLLLALRTWMNGKSLSRELEASKTAPRRTPEPSGARSAAPLFVARVALAAVAVLLIVMGVLNGGMYDVLVKAINICTECIGLG